MTAAVRAGSAAFAWWRRRRAGAPADPASSGYSIGRRLSWQVGLSTLAVLGVLFAGSWASVRMMIKQKHDADMAFRTAVISKIVSGSAAAGGEALVVSKIRSYDAMRAGTALELRSADGRLLHSDAGHPSHALSAHVVTSSFDIPASGVPGGVIRARYSVDVADDAKLGTRWAALLTLVSLGGGALAWAGAWWWVRRGLAPLHALARQTREISPSRLDQRLALQRPAEELQPWIEQFNALMDRVERAYTQLEGFNADVAHELRTPLANLIGQTEVALARDRPADELRDVLVSNLEEVQRLSAMVNDMLFLSHADRGAVARRGQPVSLAALARQVAEFHEAAIDEAGLNLRIEGDAQVAVDEPLFKRAVSNLLGNATRFAERGSPVVLRIAATEAPQQVQVVVQNAGPTIEPALLPRLFDRFFRADAARGDAHHGLGLAIVAAIARMHAGRTLAESAAGTTRVGFTLARR